MDALMQIIENKGDLFFLDIYDLPPDLTERYDGILLMDIIEHIDDDKSFLIQSTKYLKTDGFVILNVPALDSLHSRFDDLVGHKRRYTKKSLRKVMESANIEVIKIYYWGITLLFIAILRRLYLKFIPDSQIISRGMTPPNNKINRLLGLMLHLESGLLKNPFLGTSIMAIGKINKK
jgi:hypothetical protein